MPTTQFAFKEKYRYQNGFGSYHEYAFPPLVDTHMDTDRGVEQKQ